MKFHKLAEVTTERENGWNLENSWQSWSRPGCKRNNWKKFKIYSDFKTFTFSLGLYLLDCTSYVLKKNIKENVKDVFYWIILNFYSLIQSPFFIIFFFCTSPCNLDFRGFDPIPESQISVEITEILHLIAHIFGSCTHFCK